MSQSFISRVRKAIGRKIPGIGPNCVEATRLAGEAIDRRLSFRERAFLRLHLLVCRACRNYVSNLETMRGIFREPLLSETSADGLSEDARERIRKSLESE